MKSALLLFFAALLLIVSSDASAQIERGDKELSVQMSFMSRSIEQSSSSFWALLLAARYGYFLGKYLELEPEIMFSILKDEDPGFVISANLAHNFSRSNPENKIVPFILGGLGISNTFMFLPNVPFVGQETSWTILNAGAGVKLFVSEQIAVRLEYRFQRFFASSDATDHDPFQSDFESRDVTCHNLFIGLSGFFGR